MKEASTSRPSSSTATGARAAAGSATTSMTARALRILDFMRCLPMYSRRSQRAEGTLSAGGVHDVRTHLVLRFRIARRAAFTGDGIVEGREARAITRGR